MRVQSTQMLAIISRTGKKGLRIHQVMLQASVECKCTKWHTTIAEKQQTVKAETLSETDCVQDSIPLCTYTGNWVYSTHYKLLELFLQLLWLAIMEFND